MFYSKIDVYINIILISIWSNEKNGFIKYQIFLTGLKLENEAEKRI